MPLDAASPHLDALLLGTVLLLELSDRDRRVAVRRYALTKEHLERPESKLRPYLDSGSSLIYAQGSRAIGATIVNGTDDDRFDLDAILEFSVPRTWTAAYTLDMLYEALVGFPDAIAIERCTRCVQIRFPFMHLDVTLRGPSRVPRGLVISFTHQPRQPRFAALPTPTASRSGFSARLRCHRRRSGNRLTTCGRRSDRRTALAGA